MKVEKYAKYIYGFFAALLTVLAVEGIMLFGNFSHIHGLKYNLTERQLEEERLLPFCEMGNHTQIVIHDLQEKCRMFYGGPID